MLYLAIDNSWQKCEATGEYGSLGSRHLCALGAEAEGSSGKVLLLRTVGEDGARPDGQSGADSAPLAVRRLPAQPALGLRGPVGKVYRQAVHGGGEGQTVKCHVLQQDVTGLTSLVRAIQDSRRKGREQVWQLFVDACRALDRFGAAAATKQGVHLQFPASLAVDRGRGRVVPLDAEICVDASRCNAAAVAAAYDKWFDPEGRRGWYAGGREEALRLHARALLRLFAGQQAISEEEYARMMAVLNDTGLTLDGIVRGIHETFDIEVEDGPEEAEDEAPAARDRPEDEEDSPPPRKKRSLLLRLSLWLNLLLAGTVAVRILLWPKPGPAAKAKGEPAAPAAGGQDDPAQPYSSYLVLFPTEGTIGEKVRDAVQELYPGRVLEVRQGAGAMLGEKKKECVRTAGDPKKLRGLLARLAARPSIRFKGFAAGDADGGLDGVIERGGLFSFPGPSRGEHGSLLQPDGLEKVLRQANFDRGEGEESRELLKGLTAAVRDYASLRDALGIVGDRPAFLLRVKPTAAAHAAVRRKLLGRPGTPVFIARPVPGLFDAVDPSADTGGGMAAFSLQLDRKCFWRQAGRKDRREVDYAKNPTNDRMKWRKFRPGELISWKPIPVFHKDSTTDNVSSFDIAIVLDLERKVVVFRDQKVLFGETQTQVLRQARAYVEGRLRLRLGAVEDAVRVRSQGADQYTGTLIYSYLADRLKGPTPARGATSRYSTQRPSSGSGPRKMSLSRESATVVRAGRDRRRRGFLPAAQQLQPHVRPALCPARYWRRASSRCSRCSASWTRRRSRKLFAPRSDPDAGSAAAAPARAVDRPGHSDSGGGAAEPGRAGASLPGGTGDRRHQRPGDGAQPDLRQDPGHLREAEVRRGE